jgi:GntR family transcriptional repressor for pyruvate dehydrogenase complex
VSPDRFVRRLEPVDRPAVAAAVTERLEALIFDQLDFGEELPSEGKLAEALGVSRLTVREATRALEARGLLEIRQGRRPTVAAPSGALVGDFFKIAVRRDSRAVLDLLDVRMALEVHIATLAARRATTADVADLEMFIGAMRTAADEPEAFHAADVRFHEKLAAASNNRLLLFLIEALSEPLRESRLRSFAGHVARGRGAEDVIDQHVAILEAVKARNAKAAASAMRYHLQQTERDLRAERRAEPAGGRALVTASGDRTRMGGRR